MHRILQVVGAMAILGSGCGPLPAEHRTAGAGVAATNGHKLNGHKLNGHKLNGTAFGGVRVDGAGGYTLVLRGSELRARGTDGIERGGAALVGADLVGVLDNKSPIPLRITSVVHDDTDLFFYEVAAREPGSEAWTPLCGEGVGALALAGRWNAAQGVRGGGDHLEDPGFFTFACRGAALAKCVEWGYRPWESVRRCTLLGGCRTYALAPFHQACTRLVRADFCGDGRSWTLDGRAINLYDAAAVERDTEPWPFEAEWTEDGARCISQQRVIQLQADLSRLKVSVLPLCLLSKVSLTCGWPLHFQSRGTLLMSEFEKLALGIRIEL